MVGEIGMGIMYENSKNGFLTKCSNNSLLFRLEIGYNRIIER
ncbi:hypothetical protein GCM10027286_23960 [Virgibacillus ainsalahensis]